MSDNLTLTFDQSPGALAALAVQLRPLLHPSLVSVLSRLQEIPPGCHTSPMTTLPS